MGLLEQLQFVTTRITAVLPGNMQSVGTGFFYSARETSEGSVPLVVTNRHVVDGCLETWMTISLTNDGKISNGERITAVLNPNSWLYHPTSDLAACSITEILHQLEDMGKRALVSPLSKNAIATSEDISQYPVIKDIVMVGYPNGVWDDVNNLPIIRRGTTATSLEVEYQGRPEFVIDCACFPGSSGSPILATDIGMTINRSLDVSFGQSRIRLVGILWGGPQIDISGDLVAVPIPTKHGDVISSIPMNLGFAIKARELQWFEEEVERRYIPPRQPQ